MKKAVYYARVSTSGQEDEGTIESQKTEIIKQIKKDGNILVKEYIDNGWSGGRLDRPALDELRKDLKEDQFDVVYFLDTDRIARDVSYQNIIISELLKYKKQIIIKGKDYIHNPENKFNLTVIGAVNELEKSRIAERFMRGRRERARQGHIVDSGGLLGYDHHKRTDNRRAHYTINEDQAEIVRFIYQTYANTDVSITGLIKVLEKKNIKTATGKDYWKSSVIRRILTNTSYYGVHYFNRTERVESKNGADKYAKSVKTSTILKDRSEWIEVPIDPIITKDLFDRVQAKLKRNAIFLRNTSYKYLLGGLIKCGVCDHTYSGANWKGDQYYKCNYRDKLYHHNNLECLEKCNNEAIKGEVVDSIVSNTILDKVLHPQIIKKYIDVLNNSKVDSAKKLNKELEKAVCQVNGLEEKRKRVLDLYSESLVSKEDYIDKINEINAKSIELSLLKQELNRKISLLSKRKDIRIGINDFCKMARRNYKNLDKRGRIGFIKNLIDEIVILKNETQNKLIIKGVIPILAGDNNNLPQYCTSHWCRYCRRRHFSKTRRNKLGSQRGFVS